MTASSPPWHALLAPLPEDVLPRRSPVAPPELLAKPEGAAIAGWENIVLDLSAGAAGLRIVMAVLDAEGRLVAGSDHVLVRTPGDRGAPMWMRQESVGGRFEIDGSLRGTRWLTEGPEPEDDAEPRWSYTPTPASEEDARALRELVQELVRRSAPTP